MTYSETLKNRYKINNNDNEIDCLKTICINVTDYCNLKCSYCPHGHSFNSKEHIMNLNTLDKLIERLNELNYKNRLTISGFGEPMLHPYIDIIINKLKKFNVEILTNGLVVPKNKTSILKNANKIIVSVHNINDLDKIKEFWPNAIIRNHDIADKNCELIVTNRAGYLNDKYIDNICSCPFYKMFIDYDGSYLLCADDFKRKSFHNQVNIFNLSIKDYFINCLKTTKINMLNSRKLIEPCNKCNINGTVYGLDIIEKFKKEVLKIG